MAENQTLEAHLFICTNLRENGESCAQKGSCRLREEVKKICQDKSKGWHGRVRVNASGCLGHCSEGITAVLYPQGKWMTRLVVASAKELESVLSRVLDK